MRKEDLDLMPCHLRSSLIPKNKDTLYGWLFLVPHSPFIWPKNVIGTTALREQEQRPSDVRNMALKLVASTIALHPYSDY